jgi:hypothetical protein
MEDIKKLLVYFRNALAFSYSWLVLCSALVGVLYAGLDFRVAVGYSIKCETLLKLLALCAWGSACFVFAFCTKIMKKRGFLFDLTIFFILFVPVEILMFYWMDLFQGAGTVKMWIILGIFILICYITCILIDVFIMRKRSKVYTDKLMEYNSKKTGRLR